MTINEIEDRLAIVAGVIVYLDKKLADYRAEETELTYELNRARRLEREELQR